MRARVVIKFHTWRASAKLTTLAGHEIILSPYREQILNYSFTCFG